MRRFLSSLFVSLITFCLCIQGTFAQQQYLTIEEFNSNNGLPNNEIRCLHKDQKGYLWIGTLYGLVKYDGSKFTVFKHESNRNSISGDVISTIFEDRKGNIWVGANGLSILNRKSGKWSNYLHDPNNRFSISNHGILSIAQENDSIFWIMCYDGLNRFNYKTKKFTSLNFQIRSRILSSKILEIIPGNSITFNISSTLYKYDIKTNLFKILNSNINYEHNSITYFNNNVLSIKHKEPSVCSLIRYDLLSEKEYHVANLNDGSFTLFHDNEQLYLVNKNTIYSFDTRFKLIKTTFFNPSTIDSGVDYLAGLKEKNGTLWIGTSNGLFKILPSSPFHILGIENGLPNEYVRSLTIDSNNSLWIGVKSGALYKINDIDFLSQNKVNRIKTINYPTNNGEVYATNQIIELDGQNILFVTNNALYLYNRNVNKFIDRFQNKTNNQQFSALKVQDGVLVGSLDKPSLFKIIIKNNKITKDSSFHVNKIPDIVYTLYNDSKNQVWIGGEGLYKLTPLDSSKYIDVKMVIPPINESNYSNNSVWNILEVDKEKILVSTTSNGLYIYNRNTNESKHFCKNNGLSSDFSCSAIKDHHNNLWISTKEGLSLFDTKNYSIKNYTIKKGSFSCDFNFKCCSKTSNNLLLFGSKQGVVYFSPDSIICENNSYPFYVNEFRVFDDISKLELSDKDTIVLKHNENFFSFYFSLLDFRNPKEISYRYQLVNYDKEERTLANGNNTISYTDVPPGKYLLKLTCSNYPYASSEQTIELLLIIQPAFYQTGAFKTLIYFIALMIIGFIFFLVFRRQLLQSKLYKMELDLLRAQINPHFIFNTLTSIQHSILMNSKSVAADHLSKFSRLMRMCLDYSRMDYIPLEKAIHFYKTLASVESVNLNEEINFQITIDESIDKEKTHISPMLIQPFIENAIIHGLTPKNENMNLSLDICKSDGFLICSILDNGIGRVKAAEIKSNKNRSHTSIGIDLTKRSILLQLNKGRFIKDCVTIKDNYDKNGSPTGTAVFIKIPYQLKN